MCMSVCCGVPNTNGYICNANPETKASRKIKEDGVEKIVGTKDQGLMLVDSTP